MEINEVIISNHCFGEEITIDDLNFNDISEEVIKKYLINIIVKSEIIDLTTIFKLIIKEYYFDLECLDSSICDQCGNHNSEIKYIMKDEES